MNTAAFAAVGIPGPALDEETRRLLAGNPPGCVVLFARNIEHGEQLEALVDELRQLVPDALLAVDAEGGRVDRLRAIVGGAPAGAALAQLPAERAYDAGHWVGRSLRLFDFDVDLAPVVDLDRGQERNALDGRYLGADPGDVIARARAFLTGLHAAGIAGCLKHFPGLGAAAADTHEGMARIGLSDEELARDHQPFVTLGALAGAIMVAHAVYFTHEPSGRPASLSAPVTTDLLRGRLGFTGLAVADDLEMGALARWGGVPERAEAAFAAGCDLLPFCTQLAALPEVAGRLASPYLAERRRVAAQRLAVYRAHLRSLRKVPRPGPDRRGAELAAVREAFAGFDRQA